tara:strand:- start:198 stop:455 length:258 start_codon:yes stop_codon:yes gene_type:complete
MSKDNKKYFIIEKNNYSNLGILKFSIYEKTMFDLTTATRKLLALDELNTDRKNTSYHLQEVDPGLVPLMLTEEMEVKSNGATTGV